MASTPDHLVEWLRDARAMEEQAETMLELVCRRIEHYPDLRRELGNHLVETKLQSEALRKCIERRGGSVSSLKEAAGKAVAFGQALSGYFAGDEIVKATMSIYVFKHLEIASYTVLGFAARIVGDRETASVCTANLEEEKRMADWLEEWLPPITEKYLGRAAVGVEAKR